MEITKSKTVAISGYFSSQMTGRIISGRCPKYDEIKRLCEQAITELADEGYDTFITGVLDGFDLMAAMNVLEYKEQNSAANIRLIAVLPFINLERNLERNSDCRMSKIDRLYYNHVFKSADDVVLLSVRDSSAEQCALRDQYLLDNSSAILCFYSAEDLPINSNRHKLVNILPI